MSHKFWEEVKKLSRNRVFSKNPVSYISLSESKTCQDFETWQVI
jgi:hypothetical protein